MCPFQVLIQISLGKVMDGIKCVLFELIALQEDEQNKPIYI